MKLFRINKNLFYELEAYLIKNKLDSDKNSFLEIKNRLNNKIKLNPVEFAEEVIYVILVAGFSQKTAKKYFELIVNGLRKGLCENEILKIFRNKNKISAICKVWQNKEKLCAEFYKLKIVDEKISFLGKLPYIGEVTKYHLARNLGLDFVKYDVWILRLASHLYEKEYSNAKKACDKMFEDLILETGEKRGYIDVVLWKACQVGLIKFKNKRVSYEV